MGQLCVAVINLKGGSARRPIAALLGRHAVGALGLKVLALDVHHRSSDPSRNIDTPVDLDPQANLSQAYMLRRTDGLGDSYSGVFHRVGPRNVRAFG